MKTRVTKLSHSQNFLQSKELVEKLVEGSSLNKDDFAIEVGPGKGIITDALAKRCSKVLAIEADEKLYVELIDRFDSHENIEIKNQDFLESDLPKGEYKVFSNIPFNITSDLVRKLLDSENPPSDSYLIIQKDAAERFAGFAGETLFSVLYKPWFEFSIEHEFKRSDFVPNPSVDTVLLWIKKIEKQNNLC